MQAAMRYVCRISCAVSMVWTAPVSWALCKGFEGMKTIGLIGGMSWESSALYYRVINEAVRARLGGLHSARMLLWSLDFAEIERCQSASRWDDAAAILADAAERLEQAGADIILIGANTMHRIADDVQAAVAVPLLHIADATARAVEDVGAARPLLLGTEYTMSQDFYVGRLQREHGMDIVVPDADSRVMIHRVIFDELCQGQVLDSSRRAYQRVIDSMRDQGADAVILGCTEIGLLIGADDVAMPVLDTARIHAHAAVDFALD